MQNRRSWMMSAAGAAASRGRKSNLLFLISDDHAGYVLGADGNRLARTPGLDRLAAEGTRFAAHYCNSPVSTPSRQSFFTGLMPSAAGVTVLRTPLSEEKPTLAKQLRHAGYDTGVIGKMHFNQRAKPDLHGFRLVMTEDEVQRKWAGEVQSKPLPDGARTKPGWRPFKDPARIWLNAEKLPYPRYEADMKGTYIAEQACRFLREHRDDPFALWVSLMEPHSPYDFPFEDRDRFDAARFPVPRVGPEDPPQIPIIFRDLTPAEKQGIAAAYYTSVGFLDRNINRVLDQLRQLHLESDTLVVYLADHGYCLGQHGRFEKHCGYDPALRVPLIVRWPGRVRRGVVRDFTESVDVAPTILDLMGVDPLPVMHGASLRAYAEGRRPERPRDHIFSQYLENEEAFLRTARWKLIHCSGKRKRTEGYLTDNPTPGRYTRLYNLERDPGEFHDLSERYPQVVRELSGKLLARYTATHPEASRLPGGLDSFEATEWFLRPRDAAAD